MLKLYYKYKNEPDIPLYLFHNKINLQKNIKTNKPIEREYGLAPYYKNDLYSKTCFPSLPKKIKYMPICYRDDLDKNYIYNNILKNGGTNEDIQEFTKMYNRVKKYENFYMLLDKELGNVYINWKYMDIDPNFNNSYYIKRLVREHDDILFIFNRYFNLNLENYNDFIIAIICQMLNNNIYKLCGKNSRDQLIQLKTKILLDKNIKYYDIVEYIFNASMGALELKSGNNLCYLNTAMQILNVLNLNIYEIKDRRDNDLVKELIIVLTGNYDKTDKIRDELHKIYPNKYIERIMYDSTETLIDILDYLFTLNQELKEYFTSIKTEIFYDDNKNIIKKEDIKEIPTLLLSKNILREEFTFTNEKNQNITKITEYSKLADILLIGNPNDEPIENEIILNNDKYKLISSIVRYINFPHCVALINDYVYDDDIIRKASLREYQSIQLFIYFKENNYILL